LLCAHPANPLISSSACSEDESRCRHRKYKNNIPSNIPILTSKITVNISRTSQPS
jgi:hypothetical protein